MNDRVVSHVVHTFVVLFRSTADLHEYAGVSVEYHDQREPIHRHHAEQGVCDLVHVRRKGVEGNALSVTGDIRMRLEMEHHHLR